MRQVCIVCQPGVRRERPTMAQFGMAAARVGETTVHGAQRPGYPARVVEPPHVNRWVSLMRDRGMRRVCCLLPPSQLAYYPSDLLSSYAEVFGETNVCHAAIEDYRLCDGAVLEGRILPFLLESDHDAAPVVVHCSGGIGRTGHVLAAWLVRHRGLSPDDAITAVVSTGRDPREAVRCGNATEQELRRLLEGPGSRRAG
jgi:hypothetical protein